MNAALDKHEGCNIHGWLDVQRVAGNFHLSVHADHYFAMRSVRTPISGCTSASTIAAAPPSLTGWTLHSLLSEGIKYAMLLLEDRPEKAMLCLSVCLSVLPQAM